MAEHGAKVSAADKSAVEGAIASLRTALSGEDVEAIKARTNDLVQASMKLGEAIYASSQGGGGQGGGGDGGPDAGAGPGGSGPKKDDVIDADFKEVGEEDKKRRA